MIEQIKLNKSKIPFRFLCKYFGVSSSGYYFWKKQELRPRFIRKEEICDKIKIIFNDSKKTYGSPRIYQELRDLNILVSQNTVAKYMKELGLDARLKKKFKIQTTDSNHDDPIADRLFKVEDENPLPLLPGEMLAGDITYIRLGNSFLYLAVVLDLFNREVVGWSMGKSLHTQLVLDALSMAMKKVGPDAEVIFHSDRGSQYASEAYRKFLKNSHITPSMSRSGNCYDNAYVESWFASLKKEWIYRHNYVNERELKSLIFEYIEIWYNKKRKHSALDYQSPEQYKLKQISL
jgi:transposase InsO family protein